MSSDLKHWHSCHSVQEMIEVMLQHRLIIASFGTTFKSLALQFLYTTSINEKKIHLLPPRPEFVVQFTQKQSKCKVYLFSYELFCNESVYAGFLLDHF